MNLEEAIQTLYMIADETQETLLRGRMGYTAARRLSALNMAIGALRKQQEREQEEYRKEVTNRGNHQKSEKRGV